MMAETAQETPQPEQEAPQQEQEAQQPEPAAQEPTEKAESPEQEAQQPAQEESPDLLGESEAPQETSQEASEEAPDPNAPRAVETNEDGSWKDQFGNVHQPEAADPSRPEWLPEKFNKPEDLAEAYKNLEKKLGEKSSEAKESQVPEEYDLKVPESLNVESVDEDDRKFFRENGFSNEQAQAFLDYVGEGLMPQLQKANTQAQMESLGRQWEMKPDSEAFKQRLGELKKWADDTLPESVVNDLRKSANGVSAMFQMMQGKMSFAGEEAPGQQGITQADIDSMVTDERYGKDEAYTRYVEDQVRKANREK